MPLNGTLDVVLESNPSTGYKWSVKSISDANVLAAVQSGYEAPKDAQKPPMPGAPSMEVWTFNPLKTGTATIVMEYSRPWEGGTRDIKTFQLVVNVK
jgi:inhibitor of cysteine peptidase